MDIAFSIYPSIVIWDLQMPTWKKLSTMALMSLGLALVPFSQNVMIAWFMNYCY